MRVSVERVINVDFSDWANYIAQSRHGDVFEYENKPIKTSNSYDPNRGKYGLVNGLYGFFEFDGFDNFEVLTIAEFKEKYEVK